MSGVNGARGPLNCHGQSSGPTRKYGGALWCFDSDHLRAKLVLLLNGGGGGGETIAGVEDPYQIACTERNHTK